MTGTAYIDTTLNGTSYEYFIAKVRSLRGNCTLRMSDDRALYDVIKYLISLDERIKITTSNDLGLKLFRALKAVGYNIEPI